MEPLAEGNDSRKETGDLVFICDHCATPLIVDATAAGMALECQRCGKPIVVPLAATVEIPSGLAREKLAELQRHLKENESQRTEVKGHINQTSIQLHRWQLRLQTLDERNRELTEEIARLPITAQAAAVG